MPKSLGTQKWQELSRETLFEKYSRSVEKRLYRLPNGITSDYYIYKPGWGSCVLGLTADNKVITVPQYRPGPDEVLVELPGGYMDENESPVEAGMRELLEETGYSGEVDDWVGSWQLDAYSDTKAHIVVARNCRLVSKPQRDEREFGEVRLLDIDEFVAVARSGQLTDAAGALLALDHLGLLH